MRTRRRPSPSAFVVLVLVACAARADATPGSAVAGAGQRGAAGSFRFVKNIAYVGTDIDVGEFTVTRLDENGDPICVRDEAGECVRDEDGDVIYETERRDYLFAGSVNNGIRVIDVTDPEGAFIATTIPCNAFPAVVDVRPDLGVLAVGNDPNPTSCGQAGVILYDVSDPRAPVKRSVFRHARGAHNVTFHPTQPLLYISDGDLIPGSQLGQLPVVDVSNPASPVVVTTLQSHAHSPHDVTFNAAGTRAYAAAISHTDILDTTDPRAPAMIASIHDPAINIHHQADPSPDGRWLYITDEITAYSQGLSPQCPGGALHVYDVATETRPLRAGVFVAGDTAQRPFCTPHVFQLLPGGRELVISWHRAGVRMVDVSSPAGAGARELGSIITSGMGGNATASDSVTVVWYEGYVYSSDIRRGLDILQWVPGQATPRAPTVAGAFGQRSPA